MSTVTRSGGLLTLADWDALPEDEQKRKVELVEGVLFVTPRPVSRHQAALALLCAQLNAVLPDRALFAIPEVDVVVLPADPPTVRAPDLIVVPLGDARSEPSRYDGSQVMLTVEIMSPGSRRTDRIMKFADYADAGIRHYWIVDLDGGVTLDAFHLVDGRYEPVVQGATGQVSLDDPVPLTLDLDALVP